MNTPSISSMRRPDLFCVEHMKDVLSLGRSLSAEIVRSLDLAAGRVKLCPDVWSGIQNVVSFRTGGVFESAAKVNGVVAVPQVAWKVLANEIGRNISVPNRAALFEEFFVEASDSFIKERQEAMTFFYEEVYFPLPSNSPRPSVEKAIRRTRGARGCVGIVCEFSHREGNSIHAMVEAGDFPTIVKGVRALVIGAFDGEGWIWWEP